MIKKILIFLLVLLVTLFFAHVSLGKDKSSGKDSSQTLVGQVVDIGCYCAMDGKKPEELACARSCIAKGGPVGILDKNGKLHLAFGNATASANTLLAEYAGETVTVTGKLGERNGMRTVHIESVMPPVSTRSNMGFKTQTEKK
jgi:hypothetical protein